MTMTQEEQAVIFSVIAHRLTSKRAAYKEQSFINFVKENIAYFKLMKRTSPKMYPLVITKLKKI